MAGLIACAAAASGCGGDGATTTATSGGGEGGGGQGGDGAGTTGTGGQGGQGGSSPGGPAAHASGPRLRARILDGGDGANRFLDWFDSTLDHRCLFSQHEDGSLRCLPTGAYVGYRDAACTDPVVYMPPCAEAPAFVSTQVSQEAPTCDLVFGGQASPTSVRHYRAHAVGAAAPAPATLYFDYDGNCLDTQSSSAMTYFELGAVEPAETFIAGAIESVPLADGLSLKREVAEDGAWVVHSLTGPDAVTCGPARLGDDLRCIPYLESILGNHYADASCAVPAASYPGADQGCPAPAYATRGVPDETGCGNTKIELLAIGAELDPGAVFANLQSCGPLVPANPARSYYAVGAPLSPDSFPQLVSAPRGSGRLHMTGTEALDGTWLTPGGLGNYEGFIDSELAGGTSCEVSYFEDGVYRCTPQAYLTTSSLYFADAACTTPLYLVAKPPNGCAPSEPPRFQTSYGGSVTCSEVPNNGTATEVRPFIAHAEAVYIGVGADCQLIGPELSNVYDFYVLGEPSSLDLFPALEVRVE